MWSVFYAFCGRSLSLRFLTAAGNRTNILIPVNWHCLIYTNFQLFSLLECFSGNISHFCCLRSGCSGAVVGTRFIASESLENPSAKTGVFGAENWKLVFRAFTPHGRKEKIQGTYFKICLTYFKISQTYFLSPENRGMKIKTNKAGGVPRRRVRLMSTCTKRP